MNMMKTLDVVAAIIERDGKILLAQRPLAMRISQACGSLPAVRLSPGEVSRGADPRTA